MADQLISSTYQYESHQSWSTYATLSKRGKYKNHLTKLKKTHIRKLNFFAILSCSLGKHHIFRKACHPDFQDQQQFAKHIRRCIRTLYKERSYLKLPYLIAN